VPKVNRNRETVYYSKRKQNTMIMYLNRNKKGKKHMWRRKRGEKYICYKESKKQKGKEA